MDYLATEILAFAFAAAVTLSGFRLLVLILLIRVDVRLGSEADIPRTD